MSLDPSIRYINFNFFVTGLLLSQGRVRWAVAQVLILIQSSKVSSLHHWKFGELKSKSFLWYTN